VGRGQGGAGGASRRRTLARAGSKSRRLGLCWRGGGAAGSRAQEGAPLLLRSPFLPYAAPSLAQRSLPAPQPPPPPLPNTPTHTAPPPLPPPSPLAATGPPASPPCSCPAR
jgi:hypothetical protein